MHEDECGVRGPSVTPIMQLIRESDQSKRQVAEIVGSGQMRKG